MFIKRREISFIGYKLWAPTAVDLTKYIGNRPYLERFKLLSNNLFRQKKEVFCSIEWCWVPRMVSWNFSEMMSCYGC